MSNRLRLLYLEDNADDVALLQRRFARDGLDCELVVAHNGDTFFQAVKEAGFDAILADYRIPGFDGLAALEICREKCPEVPFLFLSGKIGEDLAVQALKTGAVDYILKDRMDRLTPAIRRALQEVHERAEHRHTQERLQQAHNELETRVRERTAALTETNALLKREILQREATEEALRTKTDSLTGLTSALEMHADVLAALTIAMSTFLETGDHRAANGYLLRCALKQTQSEYGFIGVMVDGPALRILCHEGNCKLPPSDCHDTDRLGCLELKDLNNLFGQVVTIREKVVCNKPATVALPEGLPPGYPPPKSFLGVPIYSGNEVVGVIGVANRKGGYTGHEQMVMETVVRQAGVLCVAYRRREGEIAAENSRQAAERCLRESEERFRLLLEGVADYAIFMVDTQGQVVSWNTGAEKMTGFTEEEIIGRHYGCFYPRDALDNGKPDQNLQLAASQGRFKEEGWRVRKDRSQFWADVVITALRDTDGNLRGFAKVIHDVTERKYAEEVLRASEERTRLIVEAAHDAFIATDADGLIITWNRQAEKMFGWCRGEVMGRRLVETVAPAKYSQEDWNSIKRAIDQRLPLSTRFEMTVQHRDRHEFPVEVAITSIPLGQEYILSGFFHDITERKRSEELLKQLPGQLLGAQEAERRRVARELHDSVSQLLSSVKIRIQSLEQNRALWCPPSSEPSNGDRNSGGQDARKSIAQARQILETCMEEVRRIARNLMPSELEDLGLVAAVRNLCKEFQDRSGLTLELKCKNIPTTLANELTLPLFRIVQEALSNAEKHSAATRVSVSLAKNGGVLAAVIKDNGKGFGTGHAHWRKARRTGMGLVNMKERASFVGGKLEVQSTPGKGTLIKVGFPMSPGKRAIKK